MTADAGCPVIVVTGLVAEARVAAGPGVLTLAGGGDAVRLAQQLDAALAGGSRGVISFGIAGGLAPDLRPGNIILADGVVADGLRRPVDSRWAARLAARLPEVRRGDLAGADHAVAGRDEKAALHRQTGAIAIDMESHVAARLAALYGVGFAALRVVADPGYRTLPQAALVGLRADGGMAIGAVLSALVRRPGDLPGLIRTAVDAGRALAALNRTRRRLPGGLAADGPLPSGAAMQRIGRDETLRRGDRLENG